MSQIISRWATPTITALFVVSLVSGVIIFFNVGRMSFTPMHEWLSMLLIIPFVMHLIKNWRPFLAYMRRPPMAIAGGISLVAALAFALPPLFITFTPPPERIIIGMLPASSVAQVAPLLGHTGESLQAALQTAGITVASAEQSIKAVAEASGRTSSQVLAAALAAKR